jgi:putative spermidine/putrescine transport system ATP-binding protein/spermidine/putrescine transport system ATP-binding protein
MSLLSIRDLSFRYSEKPVLKDLSLEVDEGEFISLLGPSGCGKTTALLLIAGFEKPEKGVIEVGGEVLNEIPAYRRNMGMVFQNYALFPHMSVIDNVAYGLRQRKMDKPVAYKAAEEALDLVQLHEMKHRMPAQLSGGQQQRVALARALVIKPRLLLLDESLSALDRKLRIEMQVELRKIQREVGITTLFVTHDQEEALTMSDRVALLRDGSVVQYDKPTVIYEHPKDPFVASFLGKANFIEGNIEGSLAGAYTLKMENGNLIQFGATQPLSVGSQYTIAVRPEKVAISTIPSKDIAVKGTISLVTYAGGITNYNILALGQEWIVQSQNTTTEGAEFSPGDEIWFGWKPENSLIL